MNYRLIRRIILTSIVIGSAILLIGYAFVLIYNRTGKFSVAVDNSDVDYAITLSEEPEFKTRSSLLSNNKVLL